MAEDANIEQDVISDPIKTISLRTPKDGSLLVGAVLDGTETEGTIQKTFLNTAVKSIYKAEFGNTDQVATSKSNYTEHQYPDIIAPKDATFAIVVIDPSAIIGNDDPYLISINIQISKDNGKTFIDYGVMTCSANVTPELGNPSYGVPVEINNLVRVTIGCKVPQDLGVKVNFQ